MSLFLVIQFRFLLFAVMFRRCDSPLDWFRFLIWKTFTLTASLTEAPLFTTLCSVCVCVYTFFDSLIPSTQINFKYLHWSILGQIKYYWILPNGNRRFPFDVFFVNNFTRFYRLATLLAPVNEYIRHFWYRF